jgi:hypothetical protein
MNVEDAIEDIVRFSLVDCLKDKPSLILAGITFVVYSIFGIITMLAIANLFTPLANISPSTAPLAIVNVIVGVYITLAVYMIPMFLVMSIFGYLIIGRALKVSKNKHNSLTISRYIKFLILSIAAGIIAGLSLYNIKWLWMLVIGLALTLSGAIITTTGNLWGISLAGIGAAVLCIYVVVFIYNSIRLSISEAIFVEGEGIINSLKKSWVITKGNVLGIAVIIIILMIVLSLLSFVLSMPAIIYTYSFTASTITTGNTLTGMGYLSDLGYLIAIWPTYIVSAYAILAGSWSVVGIYNVLTKKTKKTKKK